MITMDTFLWSPRPQANTSAPNYVIDQIREALLRRTLKPGDRLPSELEIAERCGVSRGSVRQAMKSLETLGVLSIRPGDGTYINTAVSDKSFNPLLFTLLIANPSAREMADARYALERDIFELLMADEARLAAVLPELEESIAQHKEMLENGAPLQTVVKNDLEFHRTLSHGCGNMLLQTVYDYIMEFFEYYLVDTTARQAEHSVTIAAHEKIVQALRTCNYAMAKQAAEDTVQLWYDLMTGDEIK